jgi:hypothetical protein
MPFDIVSARPRSQRLHGTPFATAEEAVRRFGAVQAQEYADAKWALALRTRRTSDASIERAFADGAILRTHVLRPTWHFVTPADIRWMLALTGPRISARMTPYNRHLELDADIFRRSLVAIARALRDSAHLTRQELKAVLQRAGIGTGVQRLAHIVMQAEVEGLICSGPRRDGQFTYALLDERVPPARALSRDEALVELTRRYFTSHGPAQVQDFAWWSGLTVGDARAGLAMIDRELQQQVVAGKTYWMSRRARESALPRTAYLLPLYDEYLIAYRDRSAALDAEAWSRRVAPRDPFSAPVVVNGRVVGGWKRRVKAGTLLITVAPFEPLSRRDRVAVEDAAAPYAGFAGLPLELSWT